jgi:hypothetical protein
MPPLPKKYRTDKPPPEQKDESPITTTPPTPPENDLEWEVSDNLWIWYNDDTRKVVMGLKCGRICVFESIDPQFKGWWTVGTTPNGYAITRVKEYDDAMRIAQHLIDHHYEWFNQSSTNKIKKAVPGYVVQWLRRCETEGKWVKPTYKVK